MACGGPGSQFRENIWVFIFHTESCFKETGAGLLKVLMSDCITNAFYLMIILVSGDCLDIKELTYAIIINVILYFDWF